MNILASLFILLSSTAAIGEGAEVADIQPPAHPSPAVTASFALVTVGRIEKTDRKVRIRLEPKYEAGLLGLEGWSHVWVMYWFDRNDTPEKRSTLQVHPRGNPANPLTGVFATRSPVRPNLIALSLCRVVSVEQNLVEVEGIDAFDGTPVLDLKPFIPGPDTPQRAITTPVWAK
jgi:tRNA-Thr(GGU) m(6)t(6)A37 methyltransferase TsaA